MTPPADRAQPVTLQPPTSGDGAPIQGLRVDRDFVCQLRRDYRYLRDAGIAPFFAKHLLYRTLLTGRWSQ